MNYRLNLLLCCLLAIGCGDLTTKLDEGGASPAPAVSTRDDIWSNVADAVNAGLIKDSTKLTLVLTHLRDLKKINDSDVSACYGLFPGIQSKELPMGADEAAKLLTLPVTMVRR